MAKNIAATVKELLSPTAESLGYILWDVEYVREGADNILRVTIDSENGINIEDCEKMHRAIDPVLDEADPIAQAYTLEVSSPGIERELRTDAHIEACIGEYVELRLFAPVDGQKRFEGILAGRGEQGEILISDGENTVAFARSAVSKIRTVYDFEQ